MGVDLTSSSCPGFAVPHAGHWMQSPGWRMKHPGHSHEPALGLNLSIRLAGGAAGIITIRHDQTGIHWGVVSCKIFRGRVGKNMDKPLFKKQSMNPPARDGET